MGMLTTYTSVGDLVTKIGDSILTKSYVMDGWITEIIETITA